MSVKRSLILKLTGLFILLAGIVWWAGSPSAAQAQCGDTPAASSCITCHTTEDPVFDKGEWHQIHARKDCCWNCHAGNTQAQDKDLAHVGLVVQPLLDPYTDCYACHPGDYQARAERFASSLGIQPISYTSPAHAAQPFVPDEELQLVVQPAQQPPAKQAFPWYPEIVVVGSAVLLLAGMLVMARLLTHSH
jgi:hypothetical protein